MSHSTPWVFVSTDVNPKIPLWLILSRLRVAVHMTKHPSVGYRGVVDKEERGEVNKTKPILMGYFGFLGREIYP
jgi:hypothetical protein